MTQGFFFVTYPLTVMTIVLISAAIMALSSTLGRFLHAEVSGKRLAVRSKTVKLYQEIQRRQMRWACITNGKLVKGAPNGTVDIP